MIQKVVPSRKSRFGSINHDLPYLFGGFYNRALDQFNSRIEVTLPGLYKYVHIALGRELKQKLLAQIEIKLIYVRSSLFVLVGILELGNASIF